MSSKNTLKTRIERQIDNDNLHITIIVNEKIIGIKQQYIFSSNSVHLDDDFEQELYAAGIDAYDVQEAVEARQSTF